MSKVVLQIPFFDWPGEAALKAYLLALTVALVVSLLIRFLRVRSFSNPTADSKSLTDRYEIAHLAGGLPHVVATAALELVICGLVTVNGEDTGSNVFVAQHPLPATAGSISRTVYEQIAKGGTTGVSAGSLVRSTVPQLAALEAKLASEGLRPTKAESRMGFSITWPLALVMIAGVGKVIVGLERDKPVGYMIALLIITSIPVILLSRRYRLTAKGRELLRVERAKALNRAHDRSKETALDLFATTGAGALDGRKEFGDIPSKAFRNRSFSEGGWHFTFGGSSDGCGAVGGGSSGCSSGCGGCGGD